MKCREMLWTLLENCLLFSPSIKPESYLETLFLIDAHEQSQHLANWHKKNRELSQEHYLTWIKWVLWNHTFPFGISIFDRIFVTCSKKKFWCMPFSLERTLVSKNRHQLNSTWVLLSRRKGNLMNSWGQGIKFEKTAWVRLWKVTQEAV